MANLDAEDYFELHTAQKNDTYRYLSLYIPQDVDMFPDSDKYNAFVECYQKHIDAHNLKITGAVYKDAGFDLLNPSSEFLSFTYMTSAKLLNLGINCSMYTFKHGAPVPVSYFLFPRSSTGLKTNVRLANSAGIIDSGYRGNIMACIEPANISHGMSLTTNAITIAQWGRLFQLCAGDLGPILVKIVTDKDKLDITSRSERGNGGFGSTGATTYL